MLKHGILGLLNYRSMTGYQIMEVFRDSLNYFWTAQTSQIYRELQTLKKSGFVTDTAVKGEGRPDKKLFSITDAGKDELIRWLRTESCLDTRSRLLMLTFFRGELTAEENIEFFNAVREEVMQFGRSLDKPAESALSYAQYVSSPENSIYWQMTVEYGKMYMKMLEEWCGKCIEMIGENKE